MGTDSAALALVMDDSGGSDSRDIHIVSMYVHGGDRSRIAEHDGRWNIPAKWLANLQIRPRMPITIHPGKMKGLKKKKSKFKYER